MTAGELVVVLAAVLCAIGFTALVVVLVRVLDMLRALREEVVDLRRETRPLIEELRLTTDEARSTVDEARLDLERFDRVLGSAEAIGDAMTGSSAVARTAFSAPVIKIVGLAKGTSRAVSRLRGGPAPARTELAPMRVIEVDDGRSRHVDVAMSRRERRRGA
jgi:hypothetical protein